MEDPNPENATRILVAVQVDVSTQRSRNPIGVGYYLGRRLDGNRES